MADYDDGVFPETQTELQKLAGVGPNTAGAIMAYAFNKPVSYIETNIRTVYIHHFFRDQRDIPDSAVLEIVDQTVPTTDPREWYYALMDYGAFLKQTQGNLNTASQSYTKQSRFEGSLRQLRGQVLRLLITRPYKPVDLQNVVTDTRLPIVLQQLEQEGLVSFTNGAYKLG